MNWLLLRGLAREQRHWGSFPETFERIVPGSRTFRLDLPGTGTENERDSPSSVAGIVEDLRARWSLLRDAHGGDWGILGISLGGMVTMEWAATHANDFQRAVIVNTSGGNLSPPWDRMVLTHAPAVIRAMLDGDHARRERSILGMTTNLATDNDARAARWAEFTRERPIRRSNVLRQIVAGARFRAPAHIAAPLLVLSGGGDGFTSPKCPAALAKHFGAPLRVHPNANHDLGTDAPEWMAGEVAGWLSETLAA